jgi:hypothetical protein
MACIQPALLHPLQQLPEGFRYEEEFLSPNQERALIASLERLPFREFEFRGFLGNRRTVSFGWRYDFNVVFWRDGRSILLWCRFRLDVRHQCID